MVYIATFGIEYALFQLDIFVASRFEPALWRNPHFIVICVILLIRIVVVLFLIGRLRPKDLGLAWRLVRPAAIVLALVWLAQQVRLAALAFIMDGSFGVHVSGALHWENPLIAMKIIGSSSEELLVRGFVMLQIYTLLRTRLTWPSSKSAALSIVLVGIGFALFHVPRLITDAASVLAATSFLSSTFLMGLALGLIFARSGNVLICMGLHCFLNLPLNVVTGSADLPMIAESAMTLTIMIVVVYAWSSAHAVEGITKKRSAT
jgi:membrane protease YdiL (CAAX protease family)